MLTFGWRHFDDTLRALDLFQRRVDEAYDDWSSFGVPRRQSARVWPALNAFETKEAFVYRAEVPGLAEGDVSVYVEDETLILRGERKSAVPEGYQVHLRERASTAFSRKVPLPGRVNAEGVTATLKDGLLTSHPAQGEGDPAPPGHGHGGLTPTKHATRGGKDHEQVTNNTVTKNGAAQAAAPQRARRIVAPDVDVYENADELLVVGDIPGASTETVDVRVENDTLTIEAKHAAPVDVAPALAREYEEVDYARSFRIPAGIDTANVRAEAKNGSVYVHLPKAAAAKPRKVAVRAS